MSEGSPVGKGPPRSHSHTSWVAAIAFCDALGARTAMPMGKHAGRISMRPVILTGVHFDRRPFGPADILTCRCQPGGRTKQENA